VLSPELRGDLFTTVHSAGTQQPDAASSGCTRRMLVSTLLLAPWAKVSRSTSCSGGRWGLGAGGWERASGNMDVARESATPRIRRRLGGDMPALSRAAGSTAPADTLAGSQPSTARRLVGRALAVVIGDDPACSRGRVGSNQDSGCSPNR
jgi:hypothetical protein